MCGRRCHRDLGQPDPGCLRRTQLLPQHAATRRKIDAVYTARQLRGGGDCTPRPSDVQLIGLTRQQPGHQFRLAAVRGKRVNPAVSANQRHTRAIGCHRHPPEGRGIHMDTFRREWPPGTILDALDVATQGAISGRTQVHHVLVVWQERHSQDRQSIGVRNCFV